jgi:hypothetical protein
MLVQYSLQLVDCKCGWSIAGSVSPGVSRCCALGASTEVYAVCAHTAVAGRAHIKCTDACVLLRMKSD